MAYNYNWLHGLEVSGQEVKFNPNTLLKWLLLLIKYGIQLTLFMGIFFFLVHIFNIEWLSIQWTLTLAFIFGIAIIAIYHTPLEHLGRNILFKMAEKPRFQELIIWIIQFRSVKDIKKVLNHRAMHELFKISWKDIQMLCKVLSASSKYQSYLCPHGIHLLQQIESHHYANKSITALVEFYEPNIITLIHQFLNNKSLSAPFMERIAHEIKLDQRKYLEKHLPPHHPLFEEIDSHSRITLNDSFSIMK